MPSLRHLVALILPLLLAQTSPAGVAVDDCADGGCFPGGGPANKDCFAEFLRVYPNEPAANPPKNQFKPKKEWSCFDGDAGCDVDGEVNGVCEFPVDVCLFNVDPNLLECTPATVTEAKAKAKKTSDGGAGLQAALDALLPAAASACTSGATVAVPLKTKKNGTQKPGKTKIKVSVKGDGGKDGDKVKLTCLPRLWPSHGANHYNTRSTKQTTITAANATTLQVKWTFPTPEVRSPGSCSDDQSTCTSDAQCTAPATCQGDTPMNGTTSTPAIGEKLVYFTSWNGSVYAVDRKKGKLKWSFDTGAIQASGSLGVQSSVTIVPDGRVLVGDSEGSLYCFDGTKGDLLWQQDLGNPDVDHIWGGPQVVNGTVLVGIASHSDQPCTQGRLVALDLDTGTEKWTTRTAPDRICENDTTTGCTTDLDCPGSSCVGMCVSDHSISCQMDADCPAGDVCGDAVGGGVTATAASSPDGQTFYMASVGCYTSPRVGNSDRIFALDPSDGSILWTGPDLGPENFVDGPPYSDWGFLNGPIVAPPSGTPAIIGASKNGILYGRTPSTGAELFTEVAEDVEAATAGFASFGWFNGAPGYQDGLVFTSGYGFDLFGDVGRCVGDATITCSDDVACGADGPCGLDSHVRAYDAATGSQVWEESAGLGPTFGSVAIADGVVFVGSSGIGGGTPELFAFDASDGTLLGSLPLPNLTSSGASMAGGELYVGYGPNLPGAFQFEQPGEGGIVAFELP